MDRRTIWPGLIALLLFGVPSAHAVPDEVARPTRITAMIGQGYAIVREEYRPAFVQPRQNLLLDLPPETDRSSLAVGDDANSVQWLGARWLVSPPPPFDGVLDLSAPGVASLTHAAPRAASRVECSLLADSARPRSVWALYQVPGFSWRARYDLTIRGDIRNQLEPLPVDLEARYYLSNGLSRALSLDRIQLLGPDRVPATPEPGPVGRGFLELDEDSPLADRWRPQKPQLETPQLYSLPDAATLAAGEVTAVRFASARRVPTDRVYVMDSERIASDATLNWKPLRQLLTFRNERRVGLGFPLPPGTALISTGVGRSSTQQEALLNHTASGGVIRVDLGDAVGISGARRSLGRAPAPSGFTEETIELWVTNSLPSAIHVEISERPPVPLAWDMVRSSRSYEILDRRLRYDLEVDPRSVVMINYTVRLTEPEDW